MTSVLFLEERSIALGGQRLSQPRDILISLDELPKDEELIGPPAPKALVDWAREYEWFIHPISVRQNADGTYSIPAGRKRTKAARLAERTHIRATVFDQNWCDEDILTLVENDQRYSNIVADVKAIEGILRKNPEADANFLTHKTGMVKSRLAKRKKLLQLIPELLGLLEIGNISESVAEAAASLSEERQRELLDPSVGRIRLRHVKALKLARKQEAVATLQSQISLLEQIEPIPVTPPSASTGFAKSQSDEMFGCWEEEAISLTDKLLSIIPPETEGRKLLIQWATELGL